jgi:hypothetical protein
VLREPRTGDDDAFEQAWAPVLDRLLHPAVLVRVLTARSLCPPLLHLCAAPCTCQDRLKADALPANSVGEDYPNAAQVQQQVTHALHSSFTAPSYFRSRSRSHHVLPAGANTLCAAAEGAGGCHGSCHRR